MNMPQWAAGVYHDGSAVYVSNLTPKLGESVTLTVRVPRDAPVLRMYLRTVPDGEGHHAAMEKVREDAISAYWQGQMAAHQPRNNYRFKLLTPQGAYYLYQDGLHRYDGPDWGDFILLADFEAPAWVNETVFYQIFPDRFNNGDPSLTPPDGAWDADGAKVKQRGWDELPKPWSESGAVDFFGGDLIGIRAKLDYLQDLGVNGIYLTPIFPSFSNHRYNIHDFYNVDPYLGGNEALVALREELDRRGMYLMLDVTPNHTGSKHPWFLEAQANPDAPTADYYTFRERPDDYEAWLGVKSLPKLNYRSQKLREQMYAGENSVLRHWLRPPYRIDGWRLDVANMAGRQGAVQLGHKIGRGIRKAVKAENPDAYLIGEHFFDSTPHLQGNEFDAVMDYQGLNVPIWRWVAGYDGGSWADGSKDNVQMATEAFAEQLTRFRAAVPWVIANMQFHQLDSHDTMRFLTICNDDIDLVKVGVGLAMTYTGVPCVYYGDEIGLPGGTDPDNRRPMPWDMTKWNRDLQAYYKTFIALRRDNPALRTGGFQTLHAEGNTYAFSRQSPEQQVIVIAHRGRGAYRSFQLFVRPANIPDGTMLKDLISGETYEVINGYVTLTLPTCSVIVLEKQ
jgi:alpha-glucosidase